MSTASIGIDRQVVFTNKMNAALLLDNDPLTSAPAPIIELRGAGAVFVEELDEVPELRFVATAATV